MAPDSTEALICGDEELSALDRELDRLFRKIKGQAAEADFQTVQAYQRGWIKGRDEAWKVDNPRQYVMKSYRERLAVLWVQAGEVEVPDPVNYTCTGGEFEDLTATFYDTETPVGVFTRTPGGDWPQYIANGSDDEGAFHYNVSGLDFIERDGKADLNWAGTLMQCERAGAQ
jgi:uncharacterized protein